MTRFLAVAMVDDADANQIIVSHIAHACTALRNQGGRASESER